jgi:4-alpha-glucanotransferase
MQDILGLGGEARMNTPGTKKGNWRWRLLPEHPTELLAKKIAALTESCGRN